MTQNQRTAIELMLKKELRELLSRVRKDYGEIAPDILIGSFIVEAASDFRNSMNSKADEFANMIRQTTVGYSITVEEYVEIVNITTDRVLLEFIEHSDSQKKINSTTPSTEFSNSFSWGQKEAIIDFFVCVIQAGDDIQFREENFLFDIFDLLGLSKEETKRLTPCDNSDQMIEVLTTLTSKQKTWLVKSCLDLLWLNEEKDDREIQLARYVVDNIGIQPFMFKIIQDGHKKSFYSRS